MKTMGNLVQKQLDRLMNFRYIEMSLISFVLIVLLSVSSLGATVSHTAEQIKSGSFGDIYTGDFSFVC